MDEIDRKLADARVAVLGSMLIDDHIIGETMRRCSPEDFGNGVCRNLYDACCRLFSEAKPIDPVTLLAAAGDEYQQAVMDIMTATPTAANWEAYVEILHEQAQLRRLQAVASEILVAGNINDAMTAMQKAEALITNHPGMKKYSFAEGLKTFIEYQQDPTPPDYLRFGLADIDRHSRIVPGDFVILAGRPSAGKSLLAAQAAWHMLRAQNKRIGIFITEGSQRKIYDRLFANIAKVDFAHIMDKHMSSSEWKNITELGRIAGSPYDVWVSPGASVPEIQAVSTAEHYDVIIIDYLQKLTAPGRDRYEIVTNVSGALQRMAAKTGMIIVALSQLSRPEKGKKYSAPTMMDLRESGQIEQDADEILALHVVDPKQKGSDRELGILKNKQGGLGMMTLGFDTTYMQFFAYEHGRVAPPEKPELQYRQTKWEDLSYDREPLPFKEAQNVQGPDHHSPA